MMKSSLRVFIIIIAITAMSYLLVDSFYRVVTPERSAVTTSVTSTATGPPPARPAAESLDSYKVITSRNLFGSVEEKESLAEVKIDVDALEPTKLNLVLLGTVASTGGFDFAVIEERGKKSQSLYKAGDVVSGAKVMKIMRSKVVLRVGDKDEVLAMEEKPRDGTPPPLAAAAGARSAVPAPSAERTISLERSTIDAAVQDMGRLMTDARIRPFFSGGQVEGLMVTNIVPGSVFQQLGLQNGDVVQGINGQTLRNPNDLVDMYRKLDTGSALAVSIRRRGKVEVLQYQFGD